MTKAKKPYVRTVLAVCFDATDEIWDDREAYIRAVLKALDIEPDMPFIEWEYRR